MLKDTVSIVIGDSIVYGLHDREFGGWVNRVRLNLENKSSNNFVINLGIPGQNSSDILKRFPSEVIPRYNDFDNFNLIFSFGIKDALIMSDDKEHIKLFSDNVLKLIKKAKKFTDNIYFIGLIKTDSVKRSKYKIENIICIDNLLKDICDKNKVNYIKLRDLIDTNDLSDGLHPNNRGHEKISKIVLERIFDC